MGDNHRPRYRHPPHHLHWVKAGAGAENANGERFSNPKQEIIGDGRGRGKISLRTEKGVCHEKNEKNLARVFLGWVHEFFLDRRDYRSRWWYSPRNLRWRTAGTAVEVGTGTGTDNYLHLYLRLWLRAEVATRSTLRDRNFSAIPIERGRNMEKMFRSLWAGVDANRLGPVFVVEVGALGGALCGGIVTLLTSNPLLTAGAIVVGGCYVGRYAYWYWTRYRQVVNG